MRSLPTSFTAGMNSGQINLAFFVELDFYEGPLRLWTGLGAITLDGNEYVGVGTLGDIQPYTQTKQLSATGFQLSLSGVSGAIISEALTTRGKGRGRPFKMFIVLMDSDFSAPLSNETDSAFYLIAGGTIDEMHISDEGSSATITINVEHDIVRLFRANHARYTDGDQQRIFPGDKFFDFTARLAGKVISWGVKSVGTMVYSSDDNKRPKRGSYRG